MVVWMCGCWMDVGDGNDGMVDVVVDVVVVVVVVGMVLHVT